MWWCELSVRRESATVDIAIGGQISIRKRRVLDEVTAVTTLSPHAPHHSNQITSNTHTHAHTHTHTRTHIHTHELDNYFKNEWGG